ncbi:hypothetical protein P7D85_02410 [Enterococcus hulanensis]|uniref:Uncharacterized protein n=1 Tax=Enterococcus hulanensis TaxID=2559929 RepID=A0ABU3EWB4_9ENTE|nr:hypothetical protein [Enterococcus hulanensis]MDT2598608.1 hypothetical protein [Enterococcus hulanensis]MDT2607887.1 hypothetical protein [Enterococcus hulanensis]MDT2615182.1 hypothetical protein [Enterococcus hulanensis]MDT2626847.1 hypothetical protein [Enterococcus hulanensis]MDT2654254.1 hypothetical protein [Enterococcus hulanensis]
MIVNQLSVIGVPHSYRLSVGTSFSAPCVASIIAPYYVKKYGELLIVDEINSALAINCIDLGISGRDVRFDYGQPILTDMLKDIAY